MNLNIHNAAAMRIYATWSFICLSLVASAQDVQNPRPLTIEEYERAKSYNIKNLDEETFVKFENGYVLDRYEMRKPYHITSDDGLKKRVDLYSLIAKEGMQQLGILVFYTNEKSVVYKVLIPNSTADSKVWDKYYEDIKAIGKIEKNFPLQLSYITSKELGFQIYKSLNDGKDLSDEASDLSNDICFPGDQVVTLSNGTTKPLSTVRPGDKIVSMDPASRSQTTITVDKLITHEARNYVITQLTMIRAVHTFSDVVNDIQMSAKVLKATPNHPIKTSTGEKAIGEITRGEQVICYDETSGRYEYYLVFDVANVAPGMQKVYNITGTTETPLVLNGVVVLQK